MFIYLKLFEQSIVLQALPFTSAYARSFCQVTIASFVSLALTPKRQQSLPYNNSTMHTAIQYPTCVNILLLLRSNPQMLQ